MQKFEQAVVKYDDPLFTNDSSIKSNSHPSDTTEEVERSNLNMMNPFDIQSQTDQQDQRQSFDFNEQQRRKFNDIVAQIVAQTMTQIMRIANNSNPKSTLSNETSFDDNSSTDGNNDEDRNTQN